MLRNPSVSKGLGIGFGAAALILASLLFLGRPASAAGVDVQLNIGNAPPPPTFEFHRRPRQVYDARSRVYVVTDPALGDNDFFRYGGFYWVFRDGYWYRSSSYRGGFTVVEPRRVPANLYRVSDRRWHHRPNGPPRFDNDRGDHGGMNGHPRSGY